MSVNDGGRLALFLKLPREHGGPSSPDQPSTSGKGESVRGGNRRFRIDLFLRREAVGEV